MQILAIRCFSGLEPVFSRKSKFESIMKIAFASVKSDTVCKKPRHVQTQGWKSDIFQKSSTDILEKNFLSFRLDDKNKNENNVILPTTFEK